MRFRRNIVAVLFASVAALLYHCANLAGGGGSEWEAKITGYVVYDGGNIPAAGARVVLCPERFLKDTASVPDSFGTEALRETVTDEGGFFSFDRLKPGIFHIEANNNQSWASFAVSEVSANDTGREIACTLKPTGRISGTLAFPEGFQGTAYIQVYGLDRVARVAAGGKFTLSDIPEGAYTLRILPSLTEYLSKDVGPVAVTTGVETDLGVLTVSLNSSAWSYKRLIYLNTSATGANVAGNVVAFPVLVRLNSGNFVFSQAQPTGADIRFIKSDNTPLPFEIERWDPVSMLAEVWVKIDTVFGNNSDQSIAMCWGNAAASGSSRSTAVFDTADGFQGVWHLGDPKDDSIRDETSNQYHGFSPDSARPSVAEGVIGNCREFDGAGDFVTMPNTASGKLNFPEDGYFTISAWVYADTLDSTYRTIAGKGHQQYFLQLTFFPGNKPWWEFSNFRETSKWNMSTTTATGKQWVLLTGVVQGSSQYLYCNGELVTDTTTNYSQNVSRDASDDFAIGRFFKKAGIPIYEYCYFKGKIDEVSVSSIARNRDWIRLSYMNQRTDDRLVQFK